jgi:hypothetical protein
VHVLVFDAKAATKVEVFYMTTISRLNTTISDHTVVTNAIAVCLIIFGVIAWNAAIGQNGSLTKSYDNVLQPATATQIPASESSVSKAQTAQTSSTALTLENPAPLSLQNQPQGITAQLQPAQATQLNGTIAVSSLQPSTNSIQLTGTNLQNASANIQ